jgi:outer membrane lipase/esterase
VAPEELLSGAEMTKSRRIVTFGVLTLAVFVAFNFSFSFQASATSLDAFYTFGDSTVDSGWWSGALNGQCGAVASPCATGNPTFDAKIASAIADGGTGAPVGVGLMNTQILASYYGLTSTPANQPGGTNYAISGSLSAVVAGSGNLNPNPNLPSTVGQIFNYLGTPVHPADPSALYLISSGGNDVTYAQNNFGTLADQKTFLANQAASLANAIHTLQLAGAQNLVVNGLQGSGTLATFYTATLFSDLSGLGVNFIGADIAGLIQNVEANPTLYGIAPGFQFPGVPGSATDSACIAGLGATGWGQFCANSTMISPDHAHLRATDSEKTSFWSDDQHLSAAGQLIEANYEFGLIQADINPTPLPAALPLFASGLGALGLLARRRKRKAALPVKQNT